MTARLPAAVVRRLVLGAGLVGCVVVVFGAVEVLAWATGARPSAPGRWLVAAVVLAVAVPKLVRPGWSGSRTGRRTDATATRTPC